MARIGLVKPLLVRQPCSDVFREVSLAAKKCPVKLRNVEYCRNDVLEAMGIVATQALAKHGILQQCS